MGSRLVHFATALSFTSIFLFAIQAGFVSFSWKQQMSYSDSGREQPLECLSGIVFAQTALGRTGNKLMEYSSAWSLAKIYNVTLVVSDIILEKINPLFAGLSGMSLSKFLRELQKKDPACARNAKKELLYGQGMPVQHWTSNQIYEIKDKQPIIIRPYIVLTKEIAQLRNVLKEEFIYQQGFQKYAETTLRRAARIFGDSVGSYEKITYVGVHVRRTDYFRYLRYKYGLQKHETASTEYYVNAVKYMLKRLSEERSFKVVFAVSSDDKRWCTQQLIPKLQTVLRSQNLLDRNATVSWCGSTNYRNDVALLSSCNHSIISYGTFGAWTALMAGGRTVVYDIKADGIRRKRTASMTFANFLPNWVTMN